MQSFPAFCVRLLLATYQGTAWATRGASSARTGSMDLRRSGRWSWYVWNSDVIASEASALLTADCRCRSAAQSCNAAETSGKMTRVSVAGGTMLPNIGSGAFQRVLAMPGRCPERMPMV